MYHIGIDIGGTKISGVLIDNKAKILKRYRVILGEKSKDNVVTKMFETISNLSANVGTKKISSIGIGVPGSFHNGKIIILPNLQCMNGTDIEKIIERRFGIDVIIENDARCFAFGESFTKNKKNMVGITLGTGFGGGIIIDGKIYHGLGSAGELGDIVVDHNGRKCSCGNKGCIEQYASSQGIEHDSKNIYGESINPESLAKMARQGDRTALGIFENFGYFLGVGLSNINYAFNPEIIAIGGGLSNCSDLFLERAIHELKKRSWIGIPKVYVSKNDSALGAALIGMMGKK